MARTRYIKPAFFLDDELSTAISPLGRLVFLGLHNLADFRGCLEWRPMAIKAQVVPFDRIDLERLLKDLIAIGRVVRYTVDGREYVKILDFQSLQNPHRQEVEKGSKLPDFASGIQVEASKASPTCNEMKSPEISDLQSQQNQTVSGEKFGTSSEPVPSIPSPSPSPSPSPKEEREASPPVVEMFAGTVEAEVAKRLDLKTLPAKLEWHRAAEWAHSNGFTADHFLECYDLLRSQDWRDGPVKPKHVMDNLPNMAKLEKEIAKQKAGVEKKNGTTGQREHANTKALREWAELAESQHSKAP